MLRSYDTKVSTVGGENLAHIQTLGDGDHRRVDESQWKVAILAHDVGHAYQVILVQRLDHKLARSDGVDERKLGVGTDPRGQQIRELGEHGDGHPNITETERIARPPRDDVLVPTVTGIHERVQRTRVGQNDRSTAYACGSRHSNSSTRVEVSA